MLESGKQYEDKDGPYIAEYYVYPFVFNGITGAQPTGVQSLQTQTDADFIIAAFRYWFIDAAAAVPIVTNATQDIPDINIQITDSASSKNLFFVPMPIHIIAANNDNNIVYLPASRGIQAGSSLTCSFATTKTFGANVFNLVLALQGYKKLRLRSR